MASRSAGSWLGVFFVTFRLVIKRRPQVSVKIVRGKSHKAAFQSGLPLRGELILCYSVIVRVSIHHLYPYMIIFGLISERAARESEKGLRIRVHFKRSLPLIISVATKANLLKLDIILVKGRLACPVVATG